MPENKPEMTAKKNRRKTPVAVPKKSKPSTVSEKDVITYLRKHRNFFSRWPELLGDIISPQSRYKDQYGDNVVDLQTIVIERLRHEHEALISTSRLNLIGQSRIHQSVLKLLEARDLEEFTEILATDLPLLLNIDVMTLCIECHPVEQPLGNIRFINKGDTDKILGKQDVRLDSDIQGDQNLFGPAYTLVRSQALIRLNFKSGQEIGLLALGVRQKDTFTPHQGTELLIFLAAVIERLLTLWLQPTIESRR